MKINLQTDDDAYLAACLWYDGKVLPIYWQLSWMIEVTYTARDCCTGGWRSEPLLYNNKYFTLYNPNLKSILTKYGWSFVTNMSAFEEAKNPIVYSMSFNKSGAIVFYNEH